jgi:AcrR family transcriptional regulator
VDSRGDATRRALVETAEQLFAERGIEAVSLRDVSAAAGQRNHYAAQYHFEDRAGLVAAVFENRMRHVNERRHALLSEFESAGRSDDLVLVVEAMVNPLADVVAETDGWYGRFLARTRWDTFAAQVLAELPVLSSFRHGRRLLAACLAHLPTDVEASRFDQLTTLLVGTVAGWEWQRQRGEPALALPALRAELVTTIVALLTAPVTTPVA